MLAWEMADPARWDVHHLMVLCYHLQHPHLYSREALPGVVDLLADFVARGVTPADVRRRDRRRLDSGNRTWKISGGTPGAYARPVAWTLTAADVIAGGPDAYGASVRAWAQAVHAALQESGNFPAS
jgi:hypothetical protein